MTMSVPERNSGSEGKEEESEDESEILEESPCGRWQKRKEQVGLSIWFIYHAGESTAAGFSIAALWALHILTSKGETRKKHQSVWNMRRLLGLSVVMYLITYYWGLDGGAWMSVLL